MPSIDELLGDTSGGPLNASLRVGIEAISGSQKITFVLYVRLVLPLDGFVFWVRSDLLSQEALLNSIGYNDTMLGQTPSIQTPAPVIEATGSLHYSSTKVQEATEVYGNNQVVFTSESPVHQDFNRISSNQMYIGEIDRIKFGFSSRGNYYRRAGINHYQGEAIHPFMMTQIVDDLTSLATDRAIVSNSLPFWLALNNYQPFYGFGNNIPLYPSHLIQSNLRPPFGSVNVPPGTTQAIASLPTLGLRYQHDQLVQETVQVVLYGANNDLGATFVDCVIQRSRDYDEFGVMNCPVVQDEKCTQNEISIIAQKKSIEFQVSYWQRSTRNLARQIIGQAIPLISTYWPASWGPAV
jgi:hypothetical protein